MRADKNSDGTKHKPADFKAPRAKRVKKAKKKTKKQITLKKSTAAKKRSGAQATAATNLFTWNADYRL